MARDALSSMRGTALRRLDVARMSWDSHSLSRFLDERQSELYPPAQVADTLRRLAAQQYKMCQRILDLKDQITAIQAHINSLASHVGNICPPEVPAVRVVDADIQNIHVLIHRLQTRLDAIDQGGFLHNWAPHATVGAQANAQSIESWRPIL